jgi:hypothetical protein
MATKTMVISIGATITVGMAPYGRITINSTWASGAAYDKACYYQCKSINSKFSHF